MTWRRDDPVDLDYDEVLATTALAVLLKAGDDEEWFPKSRCPDLEDLERDDGPGTFACPEWLAIEKGWD